MLCCTDAKSMYSAVLLAETAEKQGAALFEPLPPLKFYIMELTHTYNVRKVFLLQLRQITGRGGVFRPVPAGATALSSGPSPPGATTGLHRSKARTVRASSTSVRSTTST